MPVPGSNLLNRALSIIAKQTVQYTKYVSRTTNALGYDVSIYEAPVDIVGSFQAIERSLYQNEGLDFQKNYTRFFSSNDVIDISRDYSGDIVYYGGRKWQVLSCTNWYVQDGWKEMLLVDIGVDDNE